MKQIIMFLLIAFPVISHSKKGYELVIKVDDIWLIPENTKVGSEVKKISVVKKISQQLIFSMDINEPYKSEMENPFSISRSTGSVKLLQSFVGKVS